MKYLDADGKRIESGARYIDTLNNVSGIIRYDRQRRHHVFIRGEQYGEFSVPFSWERLGVVVARSFRRWEVWETEHREVRE